MKKQKMTSSEYSYTVIYEPIKGGGYQVVVPLLQGLVSFGRNFEEARIMAQDAIRCHLEGLKKDKDYIPTEKNFLQEKLTISV